MFVVEERSIPNVLRPGVSSKTSHSWFSTYNYQYITQFTTEPSCVERFISVVLTFSKPLSFDLLNELLSNFYSCFLNYSRLFSLGIFFNLFTLIWDRDFLLYLSSAMNRDQTLDYPCIEFYFDWWTLTSSSSMAVPCTKLWTNPGWRSWQQWISAIICFQNISYETLLARHRHLVLLLAKRWHKQKNWKCKAISKEGTFVLSNLIYFVVKIKVKLSLSKK